jgi:hypothetical protein
MVVPAFKNISSASVSNSISLSAPVFKKSDKIKSSVMERPRPEAYQSLQSSKGKGEKVSQWNGEFRIIKGNIHLTASIGRYGKDLCLLRSETELVSYLVSRKYQLRLKATTTTSSIPPGLWNRDLSCRMRWTGARRQKALEVGSPLGPASSIWCRRTLCI